VYGCVASEHKAEEGLDKEPEQWKKEGEPTPLAEFLPLRFRQPGFVRKVRLTPLAFFDLCVSHNLASEDALWAKATELSEQGDRALLSFLLENDCATCFGKVLKARKAREKLRRAGLTREQLLAEYAAQNECSCATPGHCYGLMKEILQNNNLDGIWQKEVLGALRAGRAKQRNLCLLGAADCGKSFLLKGLEEVYQTYKRPEGGSYQLEDLLEAELVLLNDFEYDTGAKDWMPWFYFKNFLEGCSVKVGVPKNKGGNREFKGTAPVFMTAAGEVTLTRQGREVVKESAQMRKRIKYCTLQWQIPEGSREEVTRVCPHCTARLYLGAAPLLDNPAAPAQAVAAAPPSCSVARAAKRQRTVAECVPELRNLKNLFDVGVLTEEEFADLKARLLRGD